MSCSQIIFNRSPHSVHASFLSRASISERESPDVIECHWGGGGVTITNCVKIAFFGHSSGNIFLGMLL